MKKLLTEFAKDLRDHPDDDIETMVKVFMISMNIGIKEKKQKNREEMMGLAVYFCMVICIFMAWAVNIEWYWSVMIDTFIIFVALGLYRSSKYGK